MGIKGNGAPEDRFSGVVAGWKLDLRHSSGINVEFGIRVFSLFFELFLSFSWRLLFFFYLSSQSEEIVSRFLVHSPFN